MKKTRFTVKCRDVAESLGLDVEFYEDDKPTKDDIFHDDGTLHVLPKGFATELLKTR